MNKVIFRTILLTILQLGLHNFSYSGIDDNEIGKANHNYSARKVNYLTRKSQRNLEDSSKYDDKSLNYIETDPSALFFNGFTLQFRRSSLFKNRMILGIGYYRANLPDFWINASPGNKDKGWSAKVQNGLDLIVDYHLFKANRGTFTGMAWSFYNFNIKRIGLKSKFTSFVPSVRLGYMWRPFSRWFYILPIAAVAYNIKISGESTIAGTSLEIRKWSFVPTINIGFSF
jgi:hypothetical protein